MMNKSVWLSILSGVMLGACSVVAADNAVPADYQQWLSDLKDEMSARGISQSTLDKAFAKNYYHPQHQVIKHDRKQNEFVLRPSEYLSRVVAPVRVKQGRQHYAELNGQYPQGVSGVPLRYLVAFWGIETNFGANKGGYNAIEALTVLSYDRRRPKFFREELYHALKILDEGHISFENMESSWAGAMGHFQFMPSTFQSYGQDGDYDGKIDIWNDFSDALSSAANYLSKMGWDNRLPWGKPVTLSWNFDYAQSGRHYRQTVAAWKKAGVQLSDKSITDNAEAALILPEGHRGQAYLVFDNFNIIMRWNRSENYALAVGLLADRVQNNALQNIKGNDNVYRLKNQDILKVQQFINQRHIAKIGTDGYLGCETRKAVQKLQQKFKLPADGYPDDRLLERIDNYEQNGYAAPVPARKLHRGKQASLRSRKKSIN